jgi:RecG-like helicase
VLITVSGLIPGQRATFEGRVNQIEDVNEGRRSRRQVVIGDSSGDVSITFRSGRGGADIAPGQLLRITGKPKQTGNRPISMIDPAYQVIEDPAEDAESKDSEQTSDT